MLHAYSAMAKRRTLAVGVMQNWRLDGPDCTRGDRISPVEIDERTP